MAIEYIFPNDNYGTEIPVWMNFYAAPFSTFSEKRTRNEVLSNPVVTISVPFPNRMSTANTQQYMTGQYSDLEGLFDKEEYDLKQSESQNSFTQGLGIISYDHAETLLTPGARRTHLFDMNLVAKTAGQSFTINNIALAFQTYMYPTAFTESLLNMGHPPLWHFFASGDFGGATIKRAYWDGNPLVSVLQSVDINRSPISSLPFMTPDFTPLAINIKLRFIELEPAMQLGDGSLGLFSRSERFTQL
jgi:hypothetical protein